MTIIVQRNRNGRLLPVGMCSIRPEQSARWVLIHRSHGQPCARLSVHLFMLPETGATELRIEAPAGFDLRSLPGWQAT